MLFKGRSQYDTVRCLTDDFAAGFREAGYAVTVMDLEQGTTESHVATLTARHAAGDLRFTFGFYGWGRNLGERDGRNWADQTGVPYVIHLIDPPYAMHARLVGVANQVVLTHDASFLSYLEAHPEIGGTFGVVGPGAPTPTADAPVVAGRRAPAILAMTVHDMRERERELDTFPPMLQKLIRHLVDAALADEHASMHDAAFEIVRPFGWLEAPSIYYRELGVLRLALRFAYDQAHAARRSRLAPALLALPLTIAGTGWEQFQVPQRRARLLGPISFREVDAHLGRASATINIMPPWPNALHDRVLYGMAAGTHVVTTGNRALSDAFVAGRDFTALPLDGGGLAELVARLRHDVDARETVAAAGRTAVAQAHTWAHRAREVAAVVARHLAPTPA